MKPALTAAKAGVKTAGTTLVGTGSRLKMAMGGMLEAPWSKVRQLEITRQAGVMSMGGVGSFKVGVKAPAGSTPLEIATAGEARAAASAIPHPQPAGVAPTAVAESTVSGAPLSIKREPVKVVTAAGDKVTQMHVTGVEGCQSHHIISWTNRHTKNHPLVKAAGYDLEHDMGNRILLPDGEAAAVSTTYRSVHQGRHVDTYSEALAKRMKDAHDFGQAEGWTPQQYREALERVISDTRQQLKSGETKLNKTTRESLGLPTKTGEK